MFCNDQRQRRKFRPQPIGARERLVDMSGALNERLRYDSSRYIISVRGRFLPVIYRGFPRMDRKIRVKCSESQMRRVTDHVGKKRLFAVSHCASAALLRGEVHHFPISSLALV